APRVGAGTFLFARGKTKGTSSRWGLYFLLVDRRIGEQEIDKGSGKVLKDETVDAIQSGPGLGTNPPYRGKVNPKVVAALQARTLTKLPVVQYLRIAENRMGGEANGYQLVLSGDQLVVEVTGSASDGTNPWQVNMDMTSGQVLSTKGGS